MDANATKYCARVRAQNHRNGKGAQERTDDLAAIPGELKKNFPPGNKQTHKRTHLQQRAFSSLHTSYFTCMHGAHAVTLVKKSYLSVEIS
ncbi:hypothetical protein pdam_00023285 [Pocillopora damicornis]|uniref:Uncharacterized protein n=1 Tax=Pocillopora damicornis TaxID=46731 RepID=A0A3M6U0A2_POCDA|nr:hypothetical protein pdam_00023285 [Pocillopora damicornis]